MRVFFCLLAIIAGVNAYGKYPLDNVLFSPGINVFVDCTNGNDSIANGAADNPYQTIAQAMASNPLEVNLISIVISNGPCNEPAIAPGQAYGYIGNDANSRVVITNGFNYVSSGDYTDIIFANLEIPNLQIDMTGSGSVSYQPRFFNCKITGGSISGVTESSLVVASFYSSYVELDSASGYPSFYDCYFARLGSVGADSGIMTQGGYSLVNPVMGDASSFRMNGGDNHAAAFQCSGTGLNQPVIYYGTSSSAPSQTGCTVVQEDDTYDTNTEHGSATINSFGTIAIGISEIYGYFDILVTPTSDFGGASWWIPESSITATGFVVHGPAGGTFRWRIVKG